MLVASLTPRTSPLCIVNLVQPILKALATQHYVHFRVLETLGLIEGDIRRRRQGG